MIRSNAWPFCFSWISHEQFDWYLIDSQSCGDATWMLGSHSQAPQLLYLGQDANVTLSHLLCLLCLGGKMTANHNRFALIILQATSLCDWVTTFPKKHSLWRWALTRARRDSGLVDWFVPTSMYLPGFPDIWIRKFCIDLSRPPKDLLVSIPSPPGFFHAGYSQSHLMSK